MPTAIDFHVHPPTHEHLVQSGGRYMQEMARYFRRELHEVPIEDMVASFREAGVERAVLFAWDAETASGLPRTSNEHVAKIVSEFADFFVGFASVDPWKGKQATQELEHAVSGLGLRGLKLHPIAQEFFPDDDRFRALFETCTKLQIPVVFHMGTTGWGAGLPGGGGVKLKYGRPIPHLDDLAANFPDLTIIGAHPGWPWTDELLAVVMHKPNVYMDLSGFRPKYFPRAVIEQLDHQLARKALFGTDYPFIEPKVWLADFGKLEMREETRSKILAENARGVLGLDAGTAR